jgi:hypothetical protein
MESSLLTIDDSIHASSNLAVDALIDLATSGEE